MYSRKTIVGVVQKRYSTYLAKAKQNIKNRVHLNQSQGGQLSIGITVRETGQNCSNSPFHIYYQFWTVISVLKTW